MSEHFYGAGDLYIDRFDSNGQSTGLVHIGSTKSFALKATSEKKELKSKSPHNYGQTIASVTLPGATELTIGHNDFDPEMMALAFLGETEAFDQASGSMTSEEITIKKVGKWYPIGFRSISETDFAVVDSMDASLAQGTDYEVNLKAGLIRALDTGDISDGDVVKITGDYDALTGTRVLGNTKPVIKAAILFEGINLVDDKEYVVNVWKTTLQPDSELDFLSEEFGETTLSGSPEIVTGKKSTFEAIKI